MRIIGGALKRRKLYFPKTFQTRPVTDRAKETIFNVLGTTCESASVLDLFAGSGSLGIEAISRGAELVCFVESGHEAASCIKKNLELLGLEAAGTVLKTTTELAIKRLQNEAKTFNLIFLDPPHNKGLIKKILHLLDHSVIVPPFGNVVV